MTDRGGGSVEYVSIQYLRGIAALLVVLFHLETPLSRAGYRADWLLGVSGGVDIFFVISGFVMWMTTRTRTVDPVTFWRKRIVRIVPLYWIVTTVMLAILLIAPSVMRTSSFRLDHVIASYLFIAARNPAKPLMEPLVFAGWTLNYEMFFYLIFGLLLLVRPRTRLVALVLIFGALAFVGIIARWPQASVGYFYTSTIMLEFVGGVLLGEWVHRRGSAGIAPTGLAWLLLIGGFAIMLPVRDAAREMRVIHFGLPAIAIVAGSIALEGKGRLREWAPLRRLGDSSYSLYLTQLMSMAAFLFVWQRLRLPLEGAWTLLYCLLDVACAVVVGLLCHRLVEQPITRWLQGRTTPRAPAAADPDSQHIIPRQQGPSSS